MSTADGSRTLRSSPRREHEKTALWLIARAASHQSDDGPSRLRLKMGDILESCGCQGPVVTVHSNCLLSVANA